jgi:hypothetical protein
MFPRNRRAYQYAAKIARTPYLTSQGPEALSIVPSVEGSTLELSATIDDVNNGGNPITAAEFYIDTPPWAAGARAHALNAGDGSFDSAQEGVQGTADVSGLSSGRHLVLVRGRDTTGNWGAFSAAWVHTGTNQAPVIVTAAAADPNPAVLPGGAAMSVSASDPDSDPLELSYTWSKVSGPGSVSFSPNGTTASNGSSATFGAAGSYVLRVTVSDGQDSVTSDVAVSVEPEPPGPPLAHWKLDEAAGATQAVDATGNGHDGTIYGDPVRVAGRLGGALSLDEVNDRVAAADFDYGSDGTFSVAFWFNVSELSGDFFQYVLSHGAVSQAGSLNVYFGEAGSSLPGVLRTNLLDGNDDADRGALDISGSWADGEWHHYALVVSASGSKVYVDGDEKASSSQGGDAFNPNTGVHLGCRAEDLDADRYYGGKLDDVRLYGHPLSAAEIAELVSGGGNAPPSIDSYMPADDPVVMTLGETETFEVFASDPDADDVLAYAWKVDGAPVEGQTASSMDYTAASAGPHTITVTVSDGNGGTAGHTWNLTVNAPPQYTLTVSTAGTGSGSVTLDPPGGTYDEGTVVTLTASPDAGSTFAGWSGAVTGTTSSVTVTMDGEKTVTATFEATGPGDLNSDGIVNIDDLALVIDHFGQSSGDAGWDARADADGNGVVNIDDLTAVTGNYGRSYK